MRSPLALVLLFLSLFFLSSPLLAAEPTNRAAFWIEPTLVALKDPAQQGYYFELHYNLTGPVNVPSTAGSGVDALYEFTLTSTSFPKFPNLNRYLGLRLDTQDLNLIRSILKGDAAIASYLNGNLMQSTRIQIQGVLDELYPFDGALGPVFNGNTPSLRVWAPTATRVQAMIFDKENTTTGTVVPMSLDEATGVWSASSSDWNYKYYQYLVTVFVSDVLGFVTNTVSDPYSVSLAADSTRSQIVDILNDPALKPTGWDSLVKPPLASIMDTVVYELHIRDFSVFDTSVPNAHRGTYNAFEYNGVNGRATSNGMKHLINLANAGFTHIHLLPSYDLASVPERRADRKDPDPAYLATFPGDSEEQQAIVGETRDVDSYNWGYDPYHYGVPDGGYAINEEQHGGSRILRYRTMVQRLAEVGLRVIQDVVYNHVFDFGQASKSVLDKVVPGYYLRMDNNGVIQQQSCCPDLATEFDLVEKLMLDNLILWAKVYKMDGFRFDLMGFHTLDNMKKVKATIEALTLAEDGVDGKAMYIYGEGWDFGSAKGKGLTIATQFTCAGTGIGTFNDRIRDAIHGGSREDSLAIRTQGFINGLSYDWNGYYYDGRYQGDLRYKADVIKFGLAGNLQNYQIIDQSGNSQTGIGFNGVGYALSPRECVNYAASHDDQSLFDLNVFKAPSGTSRANRARIQNLALSIVMLSQGVPFFDAGVDMLRSKSLDRNTYDSGDWYNGLDFWYQKNNFAIGMPPKWGNEHRYDIIRAHLQDSSIAPTNAEILSSVEHLKEMVKIRKSSKLFRLETENDVKTRLQFYNTGPNQIDAVLVMVLLDTGFSLPQIDPLYSNILCVVNADKNDKTFQIGALAGKNFQLHPVQASSSDAAVRSSRFNPNNGEIFVPQRTTSVFVVSR